MKPDGLMFGLPVSNQATSSNKKTSSKNVFFLVLKRLNEIKCVKKGFLRPA